MRFEDLTTFYGDPLTLRARVAWAHDWVDNPALHSRRCPARRSRLFGAPIPHNSALTTGSAELHFSPTWSFTAKFDGSLRPAQQTYAGTGTIRCTW